MRVVLPRNSGDVKGRPEERSEERICTIVMEGFVPNH
jgi:hypothetical protein